MQLSEEAKALFYSSWYYSGIRLLTSIRPYDSPEAIAERLSLPLLKVNQTLAFLISVGLCKEENGKFRMGPSSTHLEAEHPLATRQHHNWRVKAMQHMESVKAEEIFLTLSCSLSEETMRQIRQELVRAIERITLLRSRPYSEA